MSDLTSKIIKSLKGKGFFIKLQTFKEENSGKKWLGLRQDRRHWKIKKRSRDQI